MRLAGERECRAGYMTDIKQRAAQSILDVISRIGMAAEARARTGVGRTGNSGSGESSASRVTRQPCGGPVEEHGDWRYGLTMRGLKNKWANAWGLYGQPRGRAATDADVSHAALVELTGSMRSILQVATLAAR